MKTFDQPNLDKVLFVLFSLPLLKLQFRIFSFVICRIRIAMAISNLEQEANTSWLGRIGRLIVVTIATAAVIAIIGVDAERVLVAVVHVLIEALVQATHATRLT